MISRFSDMTSSSNFFDAVLFLLSCLVTGPSVMSISSLVLQLWQFFFIRDWPEIRSHKYPCLSFANIWRLGPVRDTKFATNVSSEMLLNAAKYQGYSFYRFWVIKGKLMGAMADFLAIGNTQYKSSSLMKNSSTK